MAIRFNSNSNRRSKYNINVLASRGMDYVNVILKKNKMFTTNFKFQ